jgi:dihydroflavonol-4-reductase
MLAEQLMLDFVERGLSAVSVMPTVILGPADTSFIGGQLITRVLDGGLFPMPEGGANLIDVRDVAEAHIAAAERGVPGERYVLGGHNMVHAVYLRIIGEVLKVPVNRLQIPRWTLPVVAEWVGLLQRLGVQMPMDRGRVLLCGRYMYYDNRKAVRELGLKLHPFEETVRDTFQWYAAHGFLARYGILGVPATADEAQEFLAEHHVSVV